MGHRMVGAVNYGPPHGVHGWSVSDGSAVCVGPGGFQTLLRSLCGRRFSDGRCAVCCVIEKHFPVGSMTY